jgi:hypothetical protein
MVRRALSVTIEIYCMMPENKSALMSGFNAWEPAMFAFVILSVEFVEGRSWLERLRFLLRQGRSALWSEHA